MEAPLRPFFGDGMEVTWNDDHDDDHDDANILWWRHWSDLPPLHRGNILECVVVHDLSAIQVGVVIASRNNKNLKWQRQIEWKTTPGYPPVYIFHKREQIFCGWVEEAPLLPARSPDHVLVKSLDVNFGEESGCEL